MRPLLSNPSFALFVSRDAKLVIAADKPQAIIEALK